MSDYRAKYLKYKRKYLELKKLENKNNMTGGGNINCDVYLFKAEWCGHCKAFKSTWNDLSDSLKNKYNFITMDSKENEKEMETWGIRSFPTIIAKKGAVAMEYHGPRDIESLTVFLEDFNKKN